MEPGTTFKVLGYDTLKSGDVQAFRGATKIYVKAIKTAPFLEEVTSQYRGRAKVQSRSGYFASEKRDVTDLSTAFEKMEVRWFSLKEALEDADFYGHNASASPTTMSSTEYVNHLTTKSMELVRKSKGIPLVSYRISDGEACAIAIMTFDFGGELRSRNPFVQLNKVLSERNTRDIYNMRKFLVLLLSGLRKLPKVCGRTVYRGISGNKILFNADHYHVGKVLTWPAFSSASFKAEVAEEHCTDENPVLFEISGDYIGYDISALALHGDEVLIEPETTIEVLSISDKKKYMFVRVKAKEKAPVISDVVKEFSKLFSGAVHFKEPPKRSTSFTKSDARKRKTSSPAPTTHHGSSSPTQRSLSPAQPLQCTPSVPWLHSGSVTPPLQLQQPLGQLPQQQQPQLPQFGAWQTPPQGSVFNQGVNLYQQSHQPTQIITTLSPSPTHASPSPAQCYSPPQSFQPQQLQFCQHPQSSSSGTPSQSSPVYQQLPQPQVPNYAPMAWTSYQTQSQYYQQQQQQQQQQQPGSYLVQHLTPIQTLTQPPFQPPQMYNQAASWQQLQSLPQPFPRNRSPGTLSHLQQQPQPQPQFYQYPQSDGFMCQKPSQPPPSAPVGSSSFLSQAVVLKFPCQKEHCSSAQGQAPEKSTLVSIAPAPLQSSPQSTTSAVTAVAPNVSSVELFAQFLVGGDKHFSSIDELCEYIEGGGLKDDVAAKYVSLCYHGIKKMRDAVKEIPGQQPRVFGDFLTVVEKMYGALRTDHCVCLVVDTCGSQVGCKENGVKWMKYVLGELGDALPLKDPAATEFRGFNDKFMFWFLAYTNVSAKEVVPIINSLSHPKFKIKARTCAYTTMATTLKEVPPIDAKAFAEAAKAELCKQYNVDVVLAVPEIKGCSLTVLFLFNNISDAYAVNGKNFTVGNFVCYVSSSVIHKCSANVLPKNEWYKLFFSTEGEYRFIWISSSASTLKCLLSGQSDNNEYAKEMCDIIESNGRQGEKKSPTHK